MLNKRREIHLHCQLMAYFQVKKKRSFCKLPDKFLIRS